MEDKTMVEMVKSRIRENLLTEINSTKKKMFFTSDSHFDDGRLNLYGRDLLFKNSKEVDDYIVQKWNETVSEKDLVIHVGDISLTKEGLETLSKLNGEKWLVKGNYDKTTEEGGTAKFEINDKILSKYFTKIVDELEVEIGGEKIYVNHFPVNAKPDQMNIVGHIHGLWKCQRNSINVGLDCWHFTPVSEDLIKFQMGGIRNHYDQNVYAGELVANIKNIKGEMRVLTPPEYCKVATFEENEDIVIFLAGPIQGAPEWHKSFMNKFKKEMEGKKLSKNIVIASPKRDEVDKTKFVYQEQVDWESFYLDKASKHGVIVFWMPKETEKVEGRSYAQTTRFEIGEWFAKGQNIKDFKIVVGAQKGFEGTRYMEYKFEQINPEFKLHESLDDVVDEVIKKIKPMI